MSIRIESAKRTPMSKVECYAFMAALHTIAKSTGRIVYLGELYNSWEPGRSGVRA